MVLNANCGDNKQWSRILTNQGRLIKHLKTYKCDKDMEDAFLDLNKISKTYAKSYILLFSADKFK